MSDLDDDTREAIREELRAVVGEEVPEAINQGFATMVDRMDSTQGRSTDDAGVDTIDLVETLQELTATVSDLQADVNDLHAQLAEYEPDTTDDDPRGFQ